MNLSLVKLAVIVGYLAMTLALGLHFRRRSSRSTEDYFVSGEGGLVAGGNVDGGHHVRRRHAAGASPASCTRGIAGNWLWWSFLLSGMMTAFLFARLWHRSGVMTDVEFAELRYAAARPRSSRFPRGLPRPPDERRNPRMGDQGDDQHHQRHPRRHAAAQPGAAASCPAGLPLSPETRAHALAICVLFLVPFTGLYVALGGLWGVLWTDLFQFVLMMGVVIAVAWHAVAAVGGMGPAAGELAAGKRHRHRRGPDGACCPTFPGAWPGTRSGRSPS